MSSNWVRLRSRALLSPAEKHLLFYCGMSGLIASQFEALLSRYRIFNGFDMTQIVPIPEQRREWYPAEG